MPNRRSVTSEILVEWKTDRTKLISINLADSDILEPILHLLRITYVIPRVPVAFGVQYVHPRAQWAADWNRSCIDF